VRHHYDVEVELAEQLRSAPREQRAERYGEVYDELFRRVPDHPQLAEAADPVTRARRIEQKLRLVGRFLEPSTRYLEVGCGDGAFVTAVAPLVADAVAVDVSEEIVAAGGRDPDVRFVLSDGVSIPVPPASIDVAFSDQLMEHLHPDDARDQLAAVAQAVAPGGWYVVCTPSRLSGPHDVSQYYDDEARGFHLHEYDLAELRTLLTEAGFSTIRVYAGGKGRYLRVPVPVVLATERVVERLPGRWRRRIGRFLPVRAVLGVNVAAKR
jgi:SAM-dependent methyltransferase